SIEPETSQSSTSLIFFRFRSRKRSSIRSPRVRFARRVRRRSTRPFRLTGRRRRLMRWASRRAILTVSLSSSSSWSAPKVEKSWFTRPSAMSTWPRARTASVTSTSVTGKPERRSKVAKRATAAERSRGTLSARRGQERTEPGLGDLGAEALHVVDVLQDAAERLTDKRLVDVVGVQRGKRLGPVERLGHPRHLREPHLPQRLHELRDLAREPTVDARHLARDDPDLLVGRRIVEPEIETPAPERVRQLARAVRG